MRTNCTDGGLKVEGGRRLQLLAVCLLPILPISPILSAQSAPSAQATNVVVVMLDGVR